MVLPADIQLIGRELAIRWEDGAETFLLVPDLRKASPSAEVSGEPDIFGRNYGGEVGVEHQDVDLVGWQKVGNYAGVTVERRSGTTFTAHGRKLKVIDLPGCYSIAAPASPDEEVTTSVLRGQARDEERPSLVVCVVDASALERHLAVVLEGQDHEHLMTPSWAGRELTEMPQATDLHVVHKVTIHYVG